MSYTKMNFLKPPKPGKYRVETMTETILGKIPLKTFANWDGTKFDKVNVVSWDYFTDKKFIVYFELYGKKMKTTIEAETEESAKKLISDKIIFHKLIVDDNFENVDSPRDNDFTKIAKEYLEDLFNKK